LGSTDIVPLAATGPIPGSIVTPFEFCADHCRVVESPAVIVAGDALIVIVAAGGGGGGAGSTSGGGGGGGAAGRPHENETRPTRTKAMTSHDRPFPEPDRPIPDGLPSFIR